MIKVFEQTDEKKVNAFLKKNVGSVIVSYSPNIVIEYTDTKNQCVPYRVIKFNPRNIKIALKNGDTIFEKYTKIRFFTDCIMFGDNIRIFSYKVGNQDHDGRAELIYKDSVKKCGIENILTCGGNISWLSGNRECGSFDYNFLDSLDYNYPDYVECDDDYKFDVRTKAIVSVGVNIKSGLSNIATNVSGAIKESGTKIASSIASQANSTDKVAEAIATGHYRQSSY